jgi:hypothetical protein
MRGKTNLARGEKKRHDKKSDPDRYVKDERSYFAIPVNWRTEVPSGTDEFAERPRQSQTVANLSGSVNELTQWSIWLGRML